MNTFVLTFIVLEVIAAMLLAGILFLLAKPRQKTSDNGTETTAEEETAVAIPSEPFIGGAPMTEIHTDDRAETKDEHADNKPICNEIAAADATTEEYRLVKSFTAKLILSDDILKERYSDIKNALLAYKKVKARTSWKCETFRLGRMVLAKLAIRGKTLCLYLALSAEEIPSEKYKVENVKQKAGAITPTMYKIKNARRVKNAKQLIRIIAEKQDLTAFNRAEENFAPAYQTEEALLTEGLIKKVKGTTFYGRK